MPCSGCYGTFHVTKTKARVDGTPKVLPDGSLLYPKIAPTLAGFKRDAHNPQRLVPTHLPCKARMCQFFMAQDGSYEIWIKCNMPGHPLRMKTVSPGDCQSCPVRRID